MPKFVVEVREVWVATYLVEASSEDEARTKIADGDFDQEWGIEYSSTIDSPEDYDVTEVEEKGGKLVNKE
jgi:hypothetical protein